MKILIGYDGSECAEAALAGLTRAGLPENAEVVILTVIDPIPGAQIDGLHGLDVLMADPMPSAPAPVTEGASNFQSYMETARGIAEKGGERLKHLFPKWTIHHKALCGSPYWGLIRSAESWNADLIIVGSHGRTAMSRVIFGSVSHFVINHAPCAVRVARCSGERPEGPIRVLLAYDNSADAQLALRAVRQRTWPSGTLVRVLGIVDAASLYITAPYEYPAGHWSAEMEKELRGMLNKSVQSAVEELQQSSLTVTGEIKEGDPKQLLLEEAESWPADSIFLGARGHSMLERFLIGSVSVAIASRAHCSAELVRPKRVSETKS